MTFCVAGDDVVSARLQKLVREPGHAESVIVTLGDGDDIGSCRVLFVGAAKQRLGTEMLQRAQGPILTVGETVQFLRDGGMVRFFVEGNRPRFQVNQRAAENRGLRFSSKVLRLAHDSR
jgi:hypothetical protein